MTQCSGRSLLRVTDVELAQNLHVTIPRVREILDMGEQKFYGTVLPLISTPYELRVQLDDIGVDYEKISEFDLFSIGLASANYEDTRIVLPRLRAGDFRMARDEAGLPILKNKRLGIEINAATQTQIADIIRSALSIKRDDKKPASLEVKQYNLERARKKHERAKNKPYQSVVEPLVFALYNCPEVNASLDDILDMTIYELNESAKQVQRRVNFDKLMVGCYSGCVDMSKIDKSELSWLM